MREDTDRQARVAVWEAGTPLDMAWWTFGDERQRGQHVERRGTGFSLAIQSLMVSGLHGRIASGEFVAWGFRVQPTISDGPVLVPADVFLEPPTDKYGSNTVAASGYTYERVSIYPASGDAIPVPPASPAEPERGQQHCERPGPKDTYPIAKVIIADLFETPELRLFSAARLLDLFNERYLAFGKSRAIDLGRLSERTLRGHRKRFLSEEFGKDRQN